MLVIRLSLRVIIMGKSVYGAYDVPSISYSSIISVLLVAYCVFMGFSAFWVMSGFGYVPVVTPFGDWVVRDYLGSKV
jgi:hypothetical protein